MRWWLWPLKLLGLLALAALISGGWLFRREIYITVRPRVERVRERIREGRDPGAPGPDALERVEEKVDSLHGWATDSVVLTAREMASLISSRIPEGARRRLDSLRLELEEGRVTVRARLETTHIPREVLGPLAGALEPWEPVAASGPVEVVAPGQAEWRVDALTLRGFTLPAQASRDLVARALPGAKDGAIPLALPAGITGIRIRSSGVALYREER